MVFLLLSYRGQCFISQLQMCTAYSLILLPSLILGQYLHILHVISCHLMPILKVRNDIRAPKIGLGMGVTLRSLDSAGESNSAAMKAQLVQKRFHDAVQLEKTKRKKLDN